MGLPPRAGDRAELRKNLKPLLERRRRARINESLSRLRGLLGPREGRLDSRPSKLDKADVLEMTVRFLRGLSAAPGPAAAPASPDGYREGYRACLARLSRLLWTRRVLEPAASARLLEHLQLSATRATPDGKLTGVPRDPRDGPGGLATEETGGGGQACPQHKRTPNAAQGTNWRPGCLLWLTVLQSSAGHSEGMRLPSDGSTASVSLCLSSQAAQDALPSEWSCSLWSCLVLPELLWHPTFSSLSLAPAKPRGSSMTVATPGPACCVSDLSYKASVSCWIEFGLDPGVRQR
ncbi:transcription factor HES-2 [Sorex fumeus]|uniref:transcription factor HES-2 n=1 Tax=Sorex fumeus TaxID=62283 RepID=UPI0024ACA1B9|nr:transcription factor HES-2 [Sorex fumeus]